MKEKESNPLMGPLNFGNRYGAIPFDKIKPEHILPAIKLGMKETAENIEKIKNNKAEPNFENTIFAFETCSDRLDIVPNIFYHLFSVKADSKLRKLSETIPQMITEFFADIYLDKQLFNRVKHVYQKRKSLNLSEEQIQLTRGNYDAFRDHGVLLNGQDKQKLIKISVELAELTTKFEDNILRATDSFQLKITDKRKLSGLPSEELEMAAALAKMNGMKPGTYLFTIRSSSYLAFMKFADNRELRKKMYLARNTQGLRREFNNQKITKRIAELRYQRAKLNEYNNPAEWILKKRMAKNPKNVYDFLDKLRDAVLPEAKKEFKELKDFAKQTDNINLRPWDTGYYLHKLQKHKFDFNEREFRPYFKLENVLKGLFTIVKKLYGISFKEMDLPVYDEQVNVYRVGDKNGKYLGLLYTDFYAREGKRGGAWASSYLKQGYFNGKIHRPHAGIHCNFSKSTSKQPSLLNSNEVMSLFHELGHALHNLFSQCRYRSISGTSVAWDFVELPSQLMENWACKKESLDVFARHYKTGKKIPKKLINKLKRVSKFLINWYCLTQLRFAYLDMAWHTVDPAQISNPVEFENKILKTMRLFSSRKKPKEEITNISCQFAHIFSGGYSAGYYSYKWAEVLEADAFELFKQKGLFNRKLAESFRRNILSQGNKRDPMELYKRFRGREPKIDALIRRYKSKK